MSDLTILLLIALIAAAVIRTVAALAYRQDPQARKRFIRISGCLVGLASIGVFMVIWVVEDKAGNLIGGAIIAAAFALGLVSTLRSPGKA